jgi:dihydrofolate reductase
MTATYTFDVFSSLDGYGSHSGGDWGGYWGKQGSELLDHRLALYGENQRMVFGANTYRVFAQMLSSSTEEPDIGDPWVTRMRRMPATVVSNTLKAPLNWPDATVVSGDAVDIVARLKEESKVPLRSHGSLSMNQALMAAGLVDRVQVTIFPVITGQTGAKPIFQGAADFDLELIESRTLDGNIQELIYQPTCISQTSIHPAPSTSRVTKHDSHPAAIKSSRADQVSQTRPRPPTHPEAHRAQPTGNARSPLVRLTRARRPTWRRRFGRAMRHRTRHPPSTRPW